MTELISQENIDFKERVNSGTSPTNNAQFDRDGYLVIRNLWDPQDLYCEPPKVKGQYNYQGKITKFTHLLVESQVNGSTSRYYWPHYKYAHSQIRLKIEKVIGKKLYNTYYYDRFYNPGQELINHTDRDSCEISVTVHVSTNLKAKSANWPIWIKTPDVYTDKSKSQILTYGENRSVILNPGDGMIYKGCERPHWRKPMPGIIKNKIRTFLGMDEYYYHQIFFHYVLSDGLRANFAFDRC